MKLVVDANVILAVVLDEPERGWAIALSEGGDAIAPRALPFEISNALSSLAKRKRLMPDDLDGARAAASKFSVVLQDIDLAAALRLAASNSMYAYNGYMLQCALEASATLLTLDRTRGAIARKLGLKVMES